MDAVSKAWIRRDSEYRYSYRMQASYDLAQERRKQAGEAA